jgi:hypothetical protein
MSEARKKRREEKRAEERRRQEEIDKVLEEPKRPDFDAPASGRIVEGTAAPREVPPREQDD